MKLSTHYYVLSLGAKTTVLYEAFRDALLLIDEDGFPLHHPFHETVDATSRSEWASRVNQGLGRCQERTPLQIVIVGDPSMRSAFAAVTAHAADVIGEVDGDHSTSSERDLGQIVWPIVREAMSGIFPRAMHKLTTLDPRQRVAVGLEAVALAVSGDRECTLLVEDDYRVRGSLVADRRPPLLTADPDVRNLDDDIVDALVDQVLGSDGVVVFVPPGSLSDRERIVVISGG